jgi:SAM-dependent methyltransferase
MKSAQFDLHASIEQRHWWFLGRRRIMQSLVRQVLPPSQDVTIVDVGCGTGGNIAALSSDYRCVGIDTSPNAILYARQRFPEVQFICGQAPSDLGDAMAQARMFLLMDVLEHVQDDFALLSTLLAAASPGTYFLVTVPADLSLWSGHDESFGHYRRYDLERLQRVWAGLPVTPLLTSYFNARLYPLIKLSRASSRRRGHSGGQSGTDFWVPARPANRLLEEVFAGESRVLGSVLNGGRAQGYHHGVSLVALLRRDAGPIATRSKPADVAPDYFDPIRGERH